MRALPVLFVTLLVPATAFGAAGKRTLTLRSAERAIDLAFQAELAGDYKGAREALVALVKTSSAADDTAGRERLDEWLTSVDERESAARVHGASARYYAAAYASLKTFGPKRADELFRRAKLAFPELKTTASVSLRVERLQAVTDKKAPERLLRQALEKQGFTVVEDKARFESRIDVDASQSEALERGARATVHASLIIREIQQDGKYKASGNVQKRRVEIRNTAAEAKSFAMRRALDDAAFGLIFHMRERMLQDVAGSVL